MSVQQQSFGAPLGNIEVPAATATVIYQLGSAAVGGIAAIIAGEKLSGIPGGMVPLWALAIPILASGAANILAATLLPGTPISEIF